ncbi:MAG: alpha/beta hydrolase [Burkholderiales bacterium]|nr:alpha/beta hydrolase [Burkholderiales bacterium]
MILHPQVQAVLDAFARMNLSPPDQIPLAQARAQFLQARAGFLAPEEAVGRVDDSQVPGPGGPVPVRIYRPAGAADDAQLPALVFFHGGGWVFGNLDSHDRLCRALCNRAHCSVIAVDYRLAPEHRFPAAVDDAIAVLRHVAQHAAGLHIDRNRIAAAGDSAGGNLVAVAALHFRDHGGPRMALQVLLYPVTDLGMGSASYRTLGTGYLLTAERMRYFAGQYLERPDDAGDWRASPLLAKSLADLPPVLIITASHDPLLDEGQAYAQRLRMEGVPAHYTCYPGVIHGFVTMAGAIDAGAQAIDQIAAALREKFA